jgi:hypothetical protein
MSSNSITNWGGNFWKDRLGVVLLIGMDSLQRRSRVFEALFEASEALVFPIGR